MRNNRTDIYIDGACPNNGYNGARGGYSLWYGDNDPRNVSERLEGPHQTNQRAELRGLQRAVESAGDLGGPVSIKTDSQYAHDCVEKWAPNWENNNWRTYDGGNVKNRDIIEPTYNRIQDLRARGHDITIDKVPAHSDNYGNEQADRLAREGARR